MGKSKDKERERDRGRDKASKKRRRQKEERSPSPERHKKHERSKDSSSRDSSKKPKKSSSSSSRRRDSKSSKEKEKKRKSASSSKDKKKDKERKDDEGSQGIQAEIQISEKDYFTRAMEFKVWLCHKKKKFFEDLTSEESHELFEKFVKDWNRGKLDPHFYEGRLPEDLVARTKKTQHKWGFVNRLTERDQMQLELANDSVHSSTEKVKGVASNVPVLPAGSATVTPKGGSGGKDADERGGEGDNGGGASDRRTEAKRQKRREREKHAVVLDEIAPKETGRQAVADKRRAVGSAMHAAARAREDAADGLDMKESDTMGGSDSFQETLARAKYGKQRRQTAKTEHLQGLAAKEAEKRAAFMAQMGLKAGQKITIQPRRDG
ncbi:unnamed protein product [Scytosiphon promiscuus]